MQEIEEYQLVYFATGDCQFRFKVKGTSVPSQWIKCSSADLAAVAAIFNEKPIYFDPVKRAITTQNEPVG